MAFRIALQMTKANLLQVVRDRRALTTLLVMPLVLIMILSSALGGIFNGKSIPTFEVSVYSADKSAASQNLIYALSSRPSLFRVHPATSQQAVEDAVTNGSASVGVEIPADYGIRSVKGAPATVRVIASLTNTTKQDMIATFINAYGRLAGDAQYVMVHTHLPNLAQSQSVNLHERSTSMHPMTAGSYYAIGMMVMFVLNAAVNRAERMVEERNSDTYKRMLASPASRRAILFGHWLSFCFLYIIQGGLILVGSRYVLGIALGDASQMALLLVSYAAALAGITVICGSLVKNPQIMDGVGGIGSQVIALLGGSVSPLQNFPQIFQHIGKMLPNGQALQSFDNSIVGCTMMTILPSIAYLLILGVIFAAVSGMAYARPAR